MPIIKAVAVSDASGDSEDSTFNVDISVDGPTHTGLATSAFVSYLADHLPNLVPLTMVLKSLLQVRETEIYTRLPYNVEQPLFLMLYATVVQCFSQPPFPQNNGLNDPFTGGLSSYGLVLMVTFSLLHRDQFSSSSEHRFDDSGFTRRDHSSPSPTAESAGQDQGGVKHEVDKLVTGHQTEEVEICAPPPGAKAFLPDSLSPGTPDAPAESRSRRPRTSIGGKRGFWQPSSLEVNANGAGIRTTRVRPRNPLDDTINSVGSRKSAWDRLVFGRVVPCSLRVVTATSLPT